MAIQQESNTSLSSNAQMHNFNIEVNSSMFSLLTKNVYTDNILAVMREWSTNAIDACIDANNPVKFEVVLPNILNQVFSVRDYGTGLSAEDVAGLFSTLGASTKRNSNAYNGQFGIGRMSGLAYTDSFTVESYMDGKQGTYLITKKDGIPNMVTLGYKDTTEENGLKLSINVNQKDIQLFKKKARELYEFFDHKPTLSEELEEVDRSQEYSGNGWLWNENYSTFGYDYGVVRVIMGNVAYKVRDYSKITTTETIDFFNYQGFCLKMPIGSIAITPGRESLNMDDRTVEALKEGFAKAREDILSSIHDKIVKGKNDWEKILIYNKFKNQFRRLHGKLSSDILKLEYKDMFDNYGEIKKIPINVSARVFYNRYNSSSTLSNEDKRIEPGNEPVGFLIADTRVHHKTAVEQMRSELWGSPTSIQYNGTVIILKMINWDKDPDKIQEHVNTCQTFLKKLGVEDIKLASDYIDTTPVQSKTPTLKSPVSPMIFSLRGASSYDFSISRSNNIIPVSDTVTKYFYIKMKSYDIEDNSFKDYEEIKTYIRAFEIYRSQNADEKIQLIGIPKTGMKDIKDVPNFLPIKGNIEHLLAKIKLVDYSFHNWIPGYHANQISFLNHLKKETTLPDDIKELTEVLPVFLEKNKVDYALIDSKRVYDLFNCEMEAPELELTPTKIEKKYPILLALLRDYRFDTERYIKYISRYINLEDKIQKD